jgi:hypothetical protein
MEYYMPTFIALASIYIVLEMSKFMVHQCFRRNYTFEISYALKEINDKLQSMPFEAVCLCKECTDNKNYHTVQSVKIDVLSSNQIETTVVNQNVSS